MISCILDLVKFTTFGHGKTPESEWLLKLEWNGMERNEIGMDARRAK